MIGSVPQLDKLCCKEEIPLEEKLIDIKIDSRISLDMKSEFSGICPFTVPSAILAVTHRLPSIHNAYGIVFLPEMLEGFSLAGKCLINSFLVEIPVQKLIG